MEGKEMITTPKIWEINNIGKNIIERTSNIANDVQEYRSIINLNINKETQNKHDIYIHEIGKDMLKIQTTEELLTNKEINLQKKLNHKKNHLQRRNIKVYEMDDGGQSILIDLEWDTSTWGDTELQGGVEALINIFQTNCSYDKKQQAVRMMTKLLERHEVAIKHMRSNIQPIMNRAISKRLNEGKTVAALNLLYILNCSKVQFYAELSHNNFVSLFFEMMLLELKLAATIIQHYYRKYREMKLNRFRTIGHLAQGWGTSIEIQRARQRSINLRTIDLKNKWRLMHSTNYNGGSSHSSHSNGNNNNNKSNNKNKSKNNNVNNSNNNSNNTSNTTTPIPSSRITPRIISTSNPNATTTTSLSSPNTPIQKKNETKVLYGMRGPIHMDLSYDLLGLEIVEYLVSEKSNDYVKINREDGLHSNSIIILLLFMSTTRSTLSYISMKILKYLSLSPESIFQLLPCDGVQTSFKYLQFYYKLHQNNPNTSITNIIEILELLSNLLHHISGIERALCNHSYIIKQIYCKDIHPIEINYKFFVNTYEKLIYNSNYSKLIFKTFGNKSLCQYFSHIIFTCQNISILKSTLMILYLLSSTICYVNVLEILLQSAGLLLVKIINFLEYNINDEENILGDISLCIILQQSIHQSSRDGFISTNIMNLLRYMFNESTYYTRLSYKRAYAIMISLCRIGEWRSYDPIKLLNEIQKPKQLINLIYFDVMKTIKQPPPDYDLYTISFDDLVLLPSNQSIVNELSDIVLKVGVKELCDYFICPSDDKYFSTLSWGIASSGCSIISAFVTKIKCAETVLSTSVVKYLGNCFYLGYTEICNKILNENDAHLYLSGCYAAAESLAVLCQAGKMNNEKAKYVVDGVMESNAAQAANYFLMTFSNSLNRMLPPKTRELQDSVALMSIKFLERYTSCLLTLRNNDATEAMSLVAQTVGEATCRVLGGLTEAFGNTPKKLRILDDLCQLLTRITEPPAGTSLALRSWKLIESLVIHLPIPLNNVGNVLTEEQIYKNGIIQLPRSIFDLISSLCKVEQGKAISLSDGFLRRALDKIALTVHHLEDDEELLVRMKQIEQGKIEEIDEHRLDIASCLNLVALSANYNNAKYGSANEMILHPNFHLIELCSRLLNSTICSRNDLAFLGALKVLRYLSRDSFRVYDLYKSYHIISIISREIKNVDTIPYDGIIDLVDSVYHIAIGMKGKHIRKELPKVKEYLTKIARIYFKLGQGVSDALWAISRNHEGNNIDLINEGPIQSDEREELIKQSNKEDLENKVITLRSGTYEACGPTSCGSLRIPGICKYHGEFCDEEINNETMKKKYNLINTQRINESNKLELTKEYATKSLQIEVKKRKEMLGLYVDEKYAQKTMNNNSEDYNNDNNNNNSSKVIFPSFNETTKSSYLLSTNDNYISSKPLKSSSSSTASRSTTILSKSLNSLPTEINTATYEPLWKKPQKKEKSKKSKDKHHIEVVTINTQELPQLLATRPQRPTSRG